MPKGKVIHTRPPEVVGAPHSPIEAMRTTFLNLCEQYANMGKQLAHIGTCFAVYDDEQTAAKIQLRDQLTPHLRTVKIDKPLP